MIENQIREDYTLLIGLYVILQGYQGKIVFSSFLMSDRSELYNELQRLKQFE